MGRNRYTFQAIDLDFSTSSGHLLVRGPPFSAHSRVAENRDNLDEYSNLGRQTRSFLMTATVQCPLHQTDENRDASGCTTEGYGHDSCSSGLLLWATSNIVLAWWIMMEDGEDLKHRHRFIGVLITLVSFSPNQLGVRMHANMSSAS